MPFDIEEEDELLNPDNHRNRRKQHIPGGSTTAGMIAASMGLRTFLIKEGIGRITVEKEAEIEKRGKKKENTPSNQPPAPKLKNKKK